MELANEVFTPSEAEVTKAKRIVEAMKQAAKEGKGAVSLDGRLIDIASIRQAEALLNKAAAMGCRPHSRTKGGTFASCPRYPGADGITHSRRRFTARQGEAFLRSW